MGRRTRLSLESLESRQLMAYDAFLKLDGIPGETKIETAEVGDPAIDDIKNDGNDDGLLVPAVQKVREAAARMNEETELPLTNDQGEDGILIGLLLPAVQKVREAGVIDEPLDELAGDTKDEGDVIPTDQFSLNYTKIEFDATLDLDLDFVDQDREAYLKYKLQDCIVTSYQL